MWQSLLELLVASQACLAHCGASPDPAEGTCSAPGQCAPVPGDVDASSEYYWPYGKGHPQYFGKSPYSGTFGGFPCNLSSSLKWSWHHPGGKYHSMIMGAPVIDEKKNIYLTILHGIRKFSPNGALLWSWDANPDAPRNYLMNTPALMHGRIYCASTDGMVHAVDMESGLMVWRVSVSGKGIGGDNGFVVARDGKVILDAEPAREAGGSKVVCLNGTDGSTLWEFQPDISVWNFLPLFPMSGGLSDGTVAFQSLSGSVYRVNLTTGQLVWRSGPLSSNTFTDGGAAIGHNGVLYAVTSLGNQQPVSSDRGGLHAFNISDGQLLWEHTDLEAGIFTWPIVAQLDDNAPLLVITGVGSLAGFPYKLTFMVGTFFVCGFGALLRILVWCCQRGCSESRQPKLRHIGGLIIRGTLAVNLVIVPSFIWYFIPNKFPYSIHAYAAGSGQLQWRVDLPTYHWPSAAGDEEGVLTRLLRTPFRPIALPCASSYPTVDAEGIIYFAHLDGNIYSIKDWNRDGVIDKETELCSFNAGASGFTGGPSIAPGLLAISTTDTMFVFGE